MEPKISLIIPVMIDYDDLSLLLNSILSQTFVDYEALFVCADLDGEAAKTILEFRELDEMENKRIRMVSCDDRNVNRMRNTGLAEAKGESVLFLEQDDVLRRTALSRLYDIYRTRMADLVIGMMTYERFGEQMITESSENLMDRPEVDHYNTEILEDIGLSNKLFRMSVIQKKGLRFSEESSNSETSFLLRFILSCGVIRRCLKSVCLKKTDKDQSKSIIVDSAHFLSDEKEFREILQIADEVMEKELLELENDPELLPVGLQEEKFKRAAFRSYVVRAFVENTLLKRYYSRLWLGDEMLFENLKRSFDECRLEVFPTQWRRLELDLPEYRLANGLLSVDEMLEVPALSVLVSDRVSPGYLETLLEAFYHQRFVAFELFLDENLSEHVGEPYRSMRNLSFLPHKGIKEFKEAGLALFKSNKTMFIDEDIAPRETTITHMMRDIGSSTFISAPLYNLDNTTMIPIRAHQTVYINEFDVVKLRTRFNQLDWMWGNKIFNVKVLRTRKILFSDNPVADMDRLYNNAKCKKTKDSAFITDLTERAILKNVSRLSVKLGYKGKLRSEEKRLERIEKENKRIVTRSQKFKRWRLKKMRDIYKYLTIKVVYPIHYKWHARKPVDEKKVIFIAAYSRNKLPNALEYVHGLIEESGKYDIHIHSLERLTLRYRDHFKRCMDLMKDFATAKYVFLDEANLYIGGFEKRKETKVVQCWHGCGAFKKFGRSTIDKKFGGDALQHKRYPHYRNYDIVTVSSPEIVWAYEEAMGLENKNIIKPIGVSRTDVFFDQDYIHEAKERIYEAVPQARGKKVILYAPTFRGRINRAAAPNRLNYVKLHEELGDDYVVLIKHHPIVKRLPKIPMEVDQSFAFDVTRTLEIADLICVADITISDYSSLIFESSLFNKPIILFAYDLSDYFDWRGFYYNYFEMAPGPILMSTEEIIDYIQNLDTSFDKEKMAQFRQKFMGACDGHSTDRILDAIGMEL